MKIKILLMVVLFSVTNFFSQDLVWNGSAGNNDFFTEANWEDASTGLAPDPDSFKWNTPINLNLLIQNVTTTISANGIINFGTGSLTISNATINGNALSNGTVTLTDSAYIDLSNASPFQNNVAIHLNSGISWVKTKDVTPAEIQASFLGQIKVNTAASVYQNNLRLDNYYFDGTVIRSDVSSTSPLTVYNKKNNTGTSASFAINVIHSGAAITNLNNKIESFILKKGFMLTMADAEDGTGKSKNYIASEEDLVIAALPLFLQNNISYIRVVPWNWVSKKGIGGDVTGLNNTWFYRWANNGLATIDLENAPMAWGVGGADDDADITIYKEKYKATHVMGFNEPDDCGAQSGQYRDLCQEDVAIGYYRNLMKAGLRIVSPGGREEAPSGWLQNFYDKATEQDIRIDVIAVHWYDWGSNPEANPNHSATTIFNRFKTYLTDVHNRFGLPIWITEFNANTNRSTAINLNFMELALPYLETLDYIERYAWFEPSSDVADYYDSSSNLTTVGSFYKNQVSSPSIPETTVADANNLDRFYVSNPTVAHNIVTNGNFETADARAWLGTNNEVLIDTSNPNISNPNAEPDIIRSIPVGNINNGVASLYQVLEVAPAVSYKVNFDYKWVSDTGTYDLTARVRSNLTGTTNITTSTSTILNTIPNVWYKMSFTFTAPTNVFKARLLFDKLSGNNPLRISNVKITLKPDKTWNGSISTDWNTAGNWFGNAVPTNTDVTFIPRGLTNYPTVTGDVTLSQLVIDSGASFITSGTVSGGVTYYADLADENWHLLSPPVSGQTMNNNWVAAAGIDTGSGTNIAIGSYQNGTPDGSTGPWQYYTGTTSSFANGKGYAMKKLSKGMFIFNGQIPSGTQNITINQGSSSPWNLIGNSFPSYIDVNDFLSQNTTALNDNFEALYVWNAETASYDALDSGYIHPGQAFFVNSNLANTTVSIAESMLSHQKNVTFYKSTPKPEVKIYFSDGMITKETTINYLDTKTRGLDPGSDIGLFNGVSNDFKIYTHLASENEGISFTKQALPNSDFESMAVPVGIKVGAGKQITFSAEATNFPEGIHLYLEDKLQNTFTRLDEKNSNYTITTANAIDGVGRFYILTRSSVLGVEKVTVDTISMYTTSKSNLRIVGISKGTSNLIIYSILGKEVMNHSFQSLGVSDVTLPKLSKGVYIFQLQTDTGSFNKKIIVD